MSHIDFEDIDIVEPVPQMDIEGTDIILVLAALTCLILFIRSIRN